MGQRHLTPIGAVPPVQGGTAPIELLLPGRRPGGHAQDELARNYRAEPVTQRLVKGSRAISRAFLTATAT